MSLGYGVPISLTTTKPKSSEILRCQSVMTKISEKKNKKKIDTVMEDVKIFIPNFSLGVVERIVRERKEKKKGTNKKETTEK